MSTNKTSGLQIAVLGSAVAMYAGILGYLHFEGPDSPLLARQGEAINQQLQSDLQQRSREAGLATADNRPIDPDQRIVRPRNGGIFDTADPAAVAATTPNRELKKADAGTRDSAPSSAAVSADASGVKATYAPAGNSVPVATGLPANGAVIPVAYTTTWRDVDALSYGQDLAGQGRQDLAARQDYRQYGNGRGRGNGRGTGSGEGEFSFSMRFTSRLRADSDITADSDWNADSRGWQDWSQSQYGQQYPATQAYYSSYSSYR